MSLALARCKRMRLAADVHSSVRERDDRFLRGMMENACVVKVKLKVENSLWSHLQSVVVHLQSVAVV